jgi:hypothetical protein
LTAEVQAAGAGAAGHADAIAAVLAEGTDVIARSQKRASSIARLFEQAEAGFQRNLRAAGERDELGNQVVGIMMGVALGVATGAVAAALLERVSKLRAVVITLGAELVGELGEWGAGEAFSKPNALPAGPDPGVPSRRQVETLERILTVSRELNALGAKATQPARAQAAATKAQAELTAQALGKGKLAPDVVEQRVRALVGLEAACAGLRQDIAHITPELGKLDAELAKALAAADIDRIEQDLWIRWIGAMTPERRDIVLRNSVIKARFAQIGMTGADGRLRTVDGFVRYGPGSDSAITTEYGLMQQVGKPGVAKSDLSPYGRATVDGREYGAHSVAGDLQGGTALRVVGTTKGKGPTDLVLEVDRAGD